MPSIDRVGRYLGNRFLVALEHPDYRTLWTASLCAGAASWALIVARGWLVFLLSDSSAWVGIVTFSAMIPRVFVTPFAGLLADRMDRRTLIAWAFAVNIIHNLILAALAITGVVQVWHLVILSLFNGSIRAMQMPASQSLIPNLVPRHHLLNAISLNAATLQGSRLVGPGLIAPLLATMGAGAAFLLCTAFYAVGLWQVLHIKTASRGIVDPQKGVIHNLLAGLDYVYRHSVILPLIILVVLHCCLTMSFESLLPVLSRDKLGAGGAGFSYLMMAVGAGALVGVLGLAGVHSERAKGWLFLSTGLVSGVTPIALAFSPSLPLALISAAGMGASQAGFMAISSTIVQSIVPDGIRGRVSSVYNWHIGGVMASFNLMNGALADSIGVATLLTVEGVAFVVIVILSLQRLPLRGFYFSGISVGTRAA